MPVQTAYLATASRDVIEGIRTRIVNALAVSTDHVRVVVEPHPNDADYKAEEGVTILIPAPEPFAGAGAGRSGLLTNRRIVVYVATSNLLDYAGNDSGGGYAHLDKEDAVINAVIDFPGGGTTQTRLGARVKWIPGGAGIGRRIKNDPSMMVSALVFDVEYSAAVQVNRD